ncbi:MAG: NUDIX domain-containing protein [Planctomycetes bacterium]|nr:NUDIX domain-containing protein [Planctomycetota bacterium]
MTERQQPRLGARAVIVREDKVLLLRAQEPSRSYYFLPGGHVQHGERLQDAVLREVKEETGLETAIVRALGVREFIASRHKRLAQNVPTTHHVVAVIFLCRVVGSGEGHFSCDAGATGVTGMEWVPLCNVARIEVHPPHLKELLMNGLSDPEFRFWPEET